MNALAQDRACRSAGTAGPGGRSLQGAAEVPGLAVDVHVEASKEVPPSASASAITSRACSSSPRRWRLREPVGSARRAVQPRPPQRLVGVDVADAGDQRLVEQRALDSARWRAQPPGGGQRGVEQRVEAGRGRSAATTRPAPVAVGAVGTRSVGQQPAERALVDEAQGAAASRSNRTRACGWAPGTATAGSPGAAGPVAAASTGCVGSSDPTSITAPVGSSTRNCPLIPRCAASTRSGSSVASQRYFPRRPVPVSVRPVSRASKSAGSRRLPPGGARVQRPRVPAPGRRSLGRETASDDLDLGQLGHRRGGLSAAVAPSTTGSGPA